MPQPTSTSGLRTQFENLGHIYVPDVYDPDQAPQLGAEVSELFRYVRVAQVVVLGEQKRGLKDPQLDPNKHKNIIAVMGNIGTLASDVIGCDLWPALSPSKTLLHALDMNPVVKTSAKATQNRITPVSGVRHRDRGLADIVAVTNFEGESRLEFDDGHRHDLKPGGVVFHNPSLYHQGSAKVKRRALVLSRTK